MTAVTPSVSQSPSTYASPNPTSPEENASPEKGFANDADRCFVGRILVAKLADLAVRQHNSHEPLRHF